MKNAVRLERIFAREYFFWILSYFVIWLPSALWITIATMKRRWLIWGSKKKETEGKKKLGVRTAIGAICFGVISTALKAIEHGGFRISDIGMIFVLAAGWGIPFLIEAGNYNPSISLCIDICKALNKSLDELFWPME